MTQRTRRRRNRIERQSCARLDHLPTFYLWILMFQVLLSRIQGFQQIQQSPLFPKRSSLSPTRRMVFNTPESVIEKASTQKLLDDLLDESVRTSARGSIMMQFDPSSGWIWKRWKGTVFSETTESCVKRMAYAVVILLLCRRFPNVVESFKGFNILWGQLLSVTTFTLTFFVNQSYALWRKCYELSRRLQGRLNDLNIGVAAHALRKMPSSPNEPSVYHPAAKQALQLISRYVRLFNLLTYASFTRSHRPILTPRGMRRLVERGLMTPVEREILVDADIPATQRHNAVLMWITRTFIEAREAGLFLGGPGFEEQWLEKVHVSRAQVGAIGDELHGRMPLAYAHIVQVLVDVVLWMYPLMAVSSGMSPLLSVLGTGLLTISYQGLVDLAKQFLDPYDNESYGKGEDPLVVDTLIAETNAGSIRWLNGLEEFPITAQRVRDGELKDSVLPARGYSVEELEQFEEERKRKEEEQRERREREELERKRIEAEEARLREGAEAIIPALVNISIWDPADPWENTTVFLREPTNLGNTTIDHGIELPDAVATTLFNLSVVVRDRNPLLVPDGVSMARPFVKESKPADHLNDAKIVDDRNGIIVNGGGARVNGRGPNGAGNESIPIPLETFDERKLANDTEVEHFEEGDFDLEEDDFDLIGDWNIDGQERYIHEFVFTSDDTTKNLWHDEIGPDGQEYRLSQMLADEVWIEELELIEEEEEAEQISNLEEFQQRAEKIKDAVVSEFLETKDILEAAPGVDSATMPSKQETQYYDQTKLDAVSQLWGLPPDELSEIPSYEEPPLEDGEDSFGTIEQLWGSPFQRTETEPEQPFIDEDFETISQLWGESLSDRQANNDDRTNGPLAGIPVVSDQVGTQQIPDAGGPRRLSEILADEVYNEESDSKEEEEKPSRFSYEDYNMQIAQILETEQEELLETEAILNAPPAAESVKVGNAEEEESVVIVANATQYDELAVLDMDNLDMDETSSPSSDSGDSATGTVELDTSVEPQHSSSTLEVDETSQIEESSTRSAEGGHDMSEEDEEAPEHGPSGDSE